MNAQPTDLNLVEPDLLQITWSDGDVRRYRAAKLRAECPCATCIERRRAPPPPAEQLQVISPEEAQPLRIAAMTPTGRYAYHIRFSDGHDTGIFTLEHLRELGEGVQE